MSAVPTILPADTVLVGMLRFANPTVESLSRMIERQRQDDIGPYEHERQSAQDDTIVNSVRHHRSSCVRKTVPFNVCRWHALLFVPTTIRAGRDRNGVMEKRHRTIADRDGEHDVAKKSDCLFGSCVNPFVANLWLALGIRFDYVDPSSACRLGGRDIAGCE